MEFCSPQDAQILSVLLSSLPDASVLAAPPVILSFTLRMALKVVSLFDWYCTRRCLLICQIGSLHTAEATCSFVVQQRLAA